MQPNRMFLQQDQPLLALRETERRLGLADRLAKCLRDPRAPERVWRRPTEIIRFRMLMIAAGYEDGNDADALRRGSSGKAGWSTRLTA